MARQSAFVMLITALVLCSSIAGLATNTPDSTKEIPSGVTRRSQARRASPSNVPDPSQEGLAPVSGGNDICQVPCDMLQQYGVCSPYPVMENDSAGLRAVNMCQQTLSSTYCRAKTKVLPGQCDTPYTGLGYTCVGAVNVAIAACRALTEERCGDSPSCAINCGACRSQFVNIFLGPNCPDEVKRWYSDITYTCGDICPYYGPDSGVAACESGRGL